MSPKRVVLEGSKPEPDAYVWVDPERIGRLGVCDCHDHYVIEPLPMGEPAVQSELVLRPEKGFVVASKLVDEFVRDLREYLTFRYFECRPEATQEEFDQVEAWLGLTGLKADYLPSLPALEGAFQRLVCACAELKERRTRDVLYAVVFREVRI